MSGLLHDPERIPGKRGVYCLGLLAIVALATPAVACAHAVAGQRVFPATLSFDDPGVANELSVNDNRIRNRGTTTNDLGVAYAKTITPRFGLGVSSDYLSVDQPGSGDRGLGNLSVSGAYQLFNNGPHEAIGLVGVSDTIANTGADGFNDDYSTFSPEFAFGKGMGDLPWSLSYLHPFAITGAISEDIPDVSSQSQMVNVGLSLQYSIPYLQDFVKNVGIPAPFDNMVPLVEYTTSVCVDGGSVCRGSGNGQRTAFYNMGVIWLGKYYQLGLEAQVPANHASGNHVGVLLGVDFYLDDILPHSLGAPLL